MQKTSVAVSLPHAAPCLGKELNRAIEPITATGTRHDAETSCPNTVDPKDFGTHRGWLGLDEGKCRFFPILRNAVNGNAGIKLGERKDNEIAWHGRHL